VAQILKDLGYQIVVVRHPMPYGDLKTQIAQRFSRYEDLEKYQVTIEEREEYEPHIAKGITVYAGVDYQEILDQAQKEADIILWDGGNNDLPFYKSDLHIVIVDPHRPGHERLYHPGETNVRMADVLVVNKLDTANREDALEVTSNIRRLNPQAMIIQAASPIFVDDPGAISGKRILVVEDGPTLTHGDMPYGAGWIAAKRFGAAEIVDPRPFAVGSIRETFEKYPATGDVLPAMGYGSAQMQELEQTINSADVDLVLIGTPIDLGRLIRMKKPSQRVRYELQEIGQPTLAEVIQVRFPKKE
jgi:predicted GTPase